MSRLFRIALALEVLALAVALVVPTPPAWLPMTLVIGCAIGVLLALAAIALDR